MSPGDANQPHPDEFADAAAAAIADACARPPSDTARVLAGAGLTGVMAGEADGGLGLGVAHALPIAEASGRLQLRFPLVEQMLLARALAGTAPAGALIGGERTGAIAWRGSLADGLAGPARLDTGCDWVLVADAERGGASLLALSGLAVQTVDAFDPECPQAWVAPASGAVVARLSAPAFERLRDEAAILFTGFVTGAAQGAIARTAAYVSQRVQFGRPLSAMQAVRHTMARMQLLVEVGAAAARRLAIANEFGDARDPWPTLATAIAQSAFVLEKAIHLHGGMGFTWDLPLHRSLRDIRALEAAFAARGSHGAVGRRFIEDRRAATVPALETP